MKVREIMTADPICCTPADNIAMVAKQMSDSHVGLLPVVDSMNDKHLVGVISDRDIVCRLLTMDGMDLNTASVGDAMTSGTLWTAKPDDDIDSLLDEMEEGQVRRIPVVDGGGKILGIVATADVALKVNDTGEVAEVFEDISKPEHFPHA